MTPKETKTNRTVFVRVYEQDRAYINDTRSGNENQEDTIHRLIHRTKK